MSANEIRFSKILLPILLLLSTGCALLQFPDRAPNPLQITRTAVATDLPMFTNNTNPSTSVPIADTPSTGTTVFPGTTPILTPTPLLYTLPPVTVAPITSTPSATPAAACDRASFVQDVTIPDGTEIAAGATFQKIWRLQNTGSCTWTSNYQIVFDQGNILGAAAVTSMPASVAPGQTVDIPISMIAPTINGSYSGYWKILNPSGTAFGVGASGTTDIYVNINVATGTSFAVSHIIMNVSNGSVTTTCPPGYPFTLYAQIETTLPGDVTYNWVFSNGTTSSQQTITIDSSLTQTVSTTFNPGANGTYWAEIFDGSPNNQYFSQVFFTLTCPQTPTNTPTITYTPSMTPTPTSTPTRTPLPTSTPTRTQTPTPTHTFTPTPTPT